MGPWLAKIPIGGIVEDIVGYSREELEKRLDEIETVNADKPFIVTRKDWLVTLFDHVRLAVNPADLFVHWHFDCDAIPARAQDRIRKFGDKLGNGAVDGMWTWLDISHTVPDWASILSLGLCGLIDRARRRRETADTDDEKLFLDCVIEIYEGLGREISRWADFAAKNGMNDVAAVLREIAVHEPRTFREALQWALVYDRAQESEGEDVRSQGLFDRLFISFYRADIEAGRETRESAKRLIADWYTRFWSQQHTNNKNIGFGGYGPDGEPVWNELTELGVEVFRELGRVNPKLTFRFGKKTPRCQLEKLTACLAEGKTSVVFVNEELMEEMFRRRGKSPEDICDYVLVGCYEPGIAGREMISSMMIDVNLAKYIAKVFALEKLPNNGDDFEREYIRLAEDALRRAMARSAEWASHWYDINPCPLFSGSSADCIAKATDGSRGGFKYNSSGVMCVGLGTVADSLAAVRYIVDEKKLLSMAGLRDALNADWTGFDELRTRVKRDAPKWGNNDDRADLPARRVYDAVSSLVNATPNGHGGYFQAGFWSITMDMTMGKCTAATPDGRTAGEMLNRNNSATAGCGTGGPTALCGSNCKLDLANAPDGHVLDLILPVSKMPAETASGYIASVLAGYFASGGQSVMLNVFDSKTLRDAMEHPEKYPDLQVRVCGWNVFWKDLSREEQLHFLKTAEAAGDLV